MKGLKEIIFSFVIHNLSQITESLRFTCRFHMLQQGISLTIDGVQLQTWILWVCSQADRVSGPQACRYLFIIIFTACS